MKVYKKDRKNFVRQKLQNDSRWALRALVVVFENQTVDEQNQEHTSHDNGVGFTGTDGNFFTSLAKQYLRRGSLTERQMVYVKKSMRKYWKQIIAASDTDKLDQMVLDWKVQQEATTDK